MKLSLSMLIVCASALVLHSAFGEPTFVSIMGWLSAASAWAIVFLEESK